MRIRLLGAAVATAAAASLTLSGAPTAVAPTALAPAPVATSNQPMVFGLLDKWKTQIDYDEQQLGMHSSIVGLFSNWQSTSPTVVGHWLQWVRSRGAAPMIDLYPPSSVRLWNITRGQQDSYLVRWAREFRAFGHPMWLRVLPEMNGNWEPYAPGRYHQTTRQYVYAFRHIVKLFRSHGATNVRMMWNPDRAYKGSTPLAKLWPGRRYVNWAGIDAYNWHDKAHGTFTPYQLLAGTVYKIRRITNKPIMLAELGVAPFRYKPGYIPRALNMAQSLGIKATVWFDEHIGKKPNWRLDSWPSPKTLTSAQSAVQQPNIAWSGHGLTLAQVDHFVLTGWY